MSHISFALLSLASAAYAGEGWIGCVTVVGPDSKMTSSRSIPFADARHGADLLPQKINGVRYTIGLGDMNNGQVQDTLSISAVADQDTKVKTDALSTSLEFFHRGAMTDGKVLTYTDEINRVSVQCVMHP